MYNRTILVQRKEDFQNQILNSLTYVDTTPAVNQFTWEDTQQCVKVNANRGSFRISLGSVNIGDIVCVECDLYSISGILPHYSLDFSDVGVEYYGNDTSGLEYIDGAGQWEKVKFKYVVKSNSKYSSVVIGLATGEVGVYKLRNVKISISTSRNMNNIYDKFIIKHENGVMEQHFKADLTVDVNSAWGSMYGGADYNLPNFPETFLNDNVICTMNVYGDMGSDYPVSVLIANRNTPTKTNAGKVTFFRGTSQTGIKVAVHVHAIGRWR